MDHLKQLAKTIEEKLTSKEAFKSIHGGGFLGKKAKKSFAIWSEAEKKTILPLHFIRHFVHQDDISRDYYGIYAFSTQGEIDTETLSQLKEKASTIDLGTVRYESFTYTQLELWRGRENSFAQENNTISTYLSDLENGLFVYVEAVGMGSNAILDKPLVIYAHHNQGDYIYPIKKTTLAKISI